MNCPSLGEMFHLRLQLPNCPEEDLRKTLRDVGHSLDESWQLVQSKCSLSAPQTIDAGGSNVRLLPKSHVVIATTDGGWIGVHNGAVRQVQP